MFSQPNRFIWSLVVLLVLFVVTPSQGATITEYKTGLPINAAPTEITSGPDGNLWFTDGGANKIGRMTRTGVITEFSIPTPNAGPFGITSGPDGNLWFTEESRGAIGRCTTSGVMDQFVGLTANALPTYITAGSDGTLWFTEFGTGKIGHITTSGVVHELSPPTNDGYSGIISGSDGNIWFSEGTSRQIGRYSIQLNSFREFPVGATNAVPQAMCVGPDGNIWFAIGGGNAAIGRIDELGHVTQFPLPLGSEGPADIVSGSDDNLWVATFNGIAKVSTSGVATSYLTPTPRNNVFGITRGADNDIYFVEEGVANPSYLGGQLGKLVPTWEARFTSKGGDGAARVMWWNPDGRFYLSTVSASGTTVNGPTYGPYNNIVPVSFATASDNTSTILWQQTLSSDALLWFLNASNTRTATVALPGH